MERSSNVEAAAHFGRSLALISSLPETAQRDEEETRLQLGLGAAVAATKGYGAFEVSRAYDRARVLCQRMGETSQVYFALHGLEAFYQVRGPLTEPRTIGEQSVELAVRSGDNLLLADAKRPLGWCLFCMGELTRADELLSDTLDLYDPTRSHPSTLTFGINTRVMAEANISWVRCFLGQPAEATRRSHEAIKLGREELRPQSLAYALCMAAAVHQCLGHPQLTRDYAEQTIALGKKNGFSYWTAWAEILRGWALAEQGEIRTEITVLRAGLAEYVATGAELFRPYSLGLLAEILGKTALPDEGLTLIEEAIDSGRRNHVLFYDAELHRLKGELLAKTGIAGVNSTSLFLRAIEIARAQSSRLLELRAAVSLYRLECRGAKAAQFRRSLSDLLTAFTDGHEFEDLAQARAALSRGGAAG